MKDQRYVLEHRHEHHRLASDALRHGPIFALATTNPNLRCLNSKTKTTKDDNRFTSRSVAFESPAVNWHTSVRATNYTKYIKNEIDSNNDWFCEPAARDSVAPSRTLYATSSSSSDDDTNRRRAFALTHNYANWSWEQTSTKLLVVLILEPVAMERDNRRDTPSNNQSNCPHHDVRLRR